MRASLALRQFDVCSHSCKALIRGYSWKPNGQGTCSPRVHDLLPTYTKDPTPGRVLGCIHLRQDENAQSQLLVGSRTGLSKCPCWHSLNLVEQAALDPRGKPRNPPIERWWEVAQQVMNVMMLLHVVTYNTHQPPLCGRFCTHCRTQTSIFVFHPCPAISIFGLSLQVLLISSIR